MERTRHKVNHESTYQVLFQRLNETLGTLQPKHLIIMLGMWPAQKVVFDG